MSSTGKENIPEYFALVLHVQMMATFLPNFSTIPKNCTSFAGEHVDCLVGKTVVLESAQGVIAAPRPFVIMVPAPCKRNQFHLPGTIGNLH